MENQSTAIDEGAVLRLVGELMATLELLLSRQHWSQHQVDSVCERLAELEAIEMVTPEETAGVHLLIPAKSDAGTEYEEAVEPGGFFEGLTVMKRIQYSHRMVGMHSDERIMARWKEALLLSSQGYTHQEIGKRLFISHSGLMHWFENMYHVFQARNRAHLIAICLREGIIK